MISEDESEKDLGSEPGGGRLEERLNDVGEERESASADRRSDCSYGESRGEKTERGESVT